MRQREREHGESKFRFPHHSRIGASGSVFTRFWWREREFDYPMTYIEKLKDPRWQRKRLEVLQRDEFTCVVCQATENQLHVHHRQYRKGADPWDYNDGNFVTLCDDCHQVVKDVQEFVSLVAGFDPSITAMRQCMEMLRTCQHIEFCTVLSIMRRNPKYVTKFYKMCRKDFSRQKEPEPDLDPSPDPEMKQ